MGISGNVDSTLSEMGGWGISGNVDSTLSEMGGWV